MAVNGNSTASNHLIDSIRHYGERQTLLMNRSCSSACLAIFTACLDRISFVWTACFDNISFVCAIFYKSNQQIAKLREKDKKRKEKRMKSNQNKTKHTLDRSFSVCLTCWYESPSISSMWSSFCAIFAIIQHGFQNSERWIYRTEFEGIKNETTKKN